jgi:hypothetical protein
MCETQELQVLHQGTTLQTLNPAEVGEGLLQAGKQRVHGLPLEETQP